MRECEREKDRTREREREREREMSNYSNAYNQHLNFSRGFFFSLSVSVNAVKTDI